MVDWAWCSRCVGEVLGKGFVHGDTLLSRQAGWSIGDVELHVGTRLSLRQAYLWTMCVCVCGDMDMILCSQTMHIENKGLKHKLASIAAGFQLAIGIRGDD
jgi:hypothetical protein